MNQDKLTREEKRLIAEFAETKYFSALEHLKNILRLQGINTFLTPTLSNDELRYWQGFVSGVDAIPDSIIQIKEEAQKKGFGE